MNDHRRSAFTLVELLVVIAIIGILVSLMLPAIQASRESARRAMCSNNLRQLVLAVHDYESAHEYYPAGTIDNAGPIKNVPKGHHISWIARILPYLEENALFANLDLSLSAYHSKNDPARQTAVDILTCPSNRSNYEPYSNYAGCHHDVEAPIDADNRGVFFLNSRLTRDDLKDGAAYTLFIGEKLIDDTDLGWLSGTPATLRNTGTRLNSSGVRSWPGGSLPWLYSYPTQADEDGWTWNDEQIDPATGETLKFNPETGIYERANENAEPPGLDAQSPDEVSAPAEVESPPSVTPSPPANESKQPATDSGESAGDDDVSGETTGTAAAEPNDAATDDVQTSDPLKLGEMAKGPDLKADANGLYPHSRLGGDPANPLRVGGFSSDHADGVNFALGDGSVRFIADSVSAGFMGRLANRADGKLIDARDW